MKSKQTEEEKIKTIKQSGILTLSNGNAIIHIDSDGNIRKIEINKVLYKN